MAFLQKNVTKITNLLGPLAATNLPTPALWFYHNPADNLAAINAANYFNGMTGAAVNDCIWVVGSDGFRLDKVTAVTAAGVVTETALLGAVS